MIMALQQTERTPEFIQFPLCADKWVELLHKGERFVMEHTTERYLIRLSN